MALPATVKYVAFMKVESSSYLKIRLDILYSIYVVFAVAIIVRYLWAIVSLLAARRRKRPTSPRRLPDYEPHEPVCALRSTPSSA
jgi:hypothetical protein